MTAERRRPHHILKDQRGLSLIEAVVALGLFALTAGTMGDYLVQQIRLSSTNYLYTQAYALAEEQLESTRALRYNDMVAGSKTTDIGGATFTIATNINDDVPANGMKQITVDVSWSDEQGPKSVAVQTIYTEVQRY